MEAKVRDEILDRVMRVLVEEKGGKMVLSKRVEKIMLSKTKEGDPKYPNVIRIVEESGSHSPEDLSSEEDDAPSAALHPKTTQEIFPGSPPPSKSTISSIPSRNLIFPTPRESPHSRPILKRSTLSSIPSKIFSRYLSRRSPYSRS